MLAPSQLHRSMRKAKCVPVTAMQVVVALAAKVDEASASASASSRFSCTLQGSGTNSPYGIRSWTRRMTAAS